jgi:hypothetical protein
MTVPRADLEAHIALMQPHITAKFSEMVINLDEVGSSDSDDRTLRKVLAPVTVFANDVFHPVSRLPSPADITISHSLLVSRRRVML